MKWSELSSLLPLARVIGEGDPEISDLQMDSRLVKAGAAFLCVPGKMVDGHDFAAQAVEKGAVALIAERPLEVPVPQLIVRDIRLAMPLLACHFFAYPTQRLRVIGVTGTNGKTTTTHLMERILADAGLSTGLMGTIGVRIGQETVESKNTTMESLELQRAFRQMVDLGTQYALIEVSSHALALSRVRGVQFRSGVFTNLTQDHLDFHETMDKYRAAKGMLFTRMSNGYEAGEGRRQFAVLNADDAASAEYEAGTSANVVTYGIDQPADVRASAIRITAGGTEFRCETFAGACEFRLKMMGKFSVYNALAATATCLLEGVSLTQIRDSLAEIGGVDGRFEPVALGQTYSVIVDYAHTPDSLENVLTTIREFATRRVICVFGCGGNRDRGKRPLMAAIAARYSDYVVATSDNPRFEEPEEILRDVVAGFVGTETEHTQIADRKLAIEHAIQMAEAGDVVLIAGKGHETYQEIRGVRHPSDDRELARAAIRTSLGGQEAGR